MKTKKYETNIFGLSDYCAASVRTVSSMSIFQSMRAVSSMIVLVCVIDIIVFASVRAVSLMIIIGICDCSNINVTASVRAVS